MFKGFIETMVKIMGIIFVAIPFTLICIALACTLLFGAFMCFGWIGLIIVGLILFTAIYKNSKKYKNR